MAAGSVRRSRALLCLALGLVLLGGALAAWVQTDGGSVSIRDVRFTRTDGAVMSGLLYVPNEATAATPAPAVLAMHGYMNSRETQNPFAIELARRGYVTLALDEPGHGYSDPPALSAGFGGPAGLAFLRSLDFVDKDNIGLSGHSMGAWAAIAAAAAFPDGYRSLVIESSAPLTASKDTPAFPRNTMLLFSQWEEFSGSPLFWSSPDPDDAVASAKMMTLFGTDRPVEEGRLYGSITDGSARILERVTTDHPGMHWSPSGTSHVVDWFGQTLKGGHEASGQIWWLKEIGTLMAMAGGMLFMFSFGSLLLATPFFAKLRRPVPPSHGVKPGLPYWIAAAVATAIPAVTFFYLQDKGGTDWMDPDTWFPQQLTNGVLVWAWGVGAIALALMAIWHFTLNRRAGATLRHYGLAATERSTPGVIGRAAVLALSIGAGVYGLLVVSDLLFMTDFRFWIYQLHLIDAIHLQLFLTYLLPFAVFFVAIGTVLHGQLRPAGQRRSMAHAMVANALILAGGLVVLMVADYIPLIAGGHLWIDTQPLLAIVSGLQFIPILVLVAIISTYFFKLTGTVYTGAFISAVFVTWNLSAGTATQFAIEPWDRTGMVVRVALPLLAAVVLLAGAVVLRRRAAPDGAEAQTIPTADETEPADTEIASV